MKSVIRKEYCTPEEMEVVETPRPSPGRGQVLVELRAVSLNASDHEFLTGRPYYARLFGLFRPRHQVLGSDIAGVIVEVGDGVSEFNLGDRVYGDIMYHSFGGFAEFVAVDADALSLIPAPLSFEEAATIPQAGVIALQGIRDVGRVREGDQVLINGGGGGGGTFAIQLAKMRGAEVTAVDNAEKLESMRAAGADHVIDYRSEDFVDRAAQYDFILDLFATREISRLERAVKPTGIYAAVGGWVSTVLHILIWGAIVRLFSDRVFSILGADQNNKKDLQEMADLISKKKITPAIDRRFGLEQVPEAMRYLLDGHAKGKVLILPQLAGGDAIDEPSESSRQSVPAPVTGTATAFSSLPLCSVGLHHWA